MNPVMTYFNMLSKHFLKVNDNESRQLIVNDSGTKSQMSTNETTPFTS